MAGPGRPGSLYSTTQAFYGSLVYLGTLVSTGAAVNNATTATPFNYLPLGGTANPNSLTNTLAGKTLIFQLSAAGSILPSTSASMTITGTSSIIALQSVVPPLQGTVPGLGFVLGERGQFIMLPTTGWLQFIPVSGSANCLVWELL